MPILDTILPQMQHALQSQLVGGGLVLMVVGTIGAFCRRLPGQLWGFIRRQVVVTVDVMNTDNAFAALTLWLKDLPAVQRGRLLTAATVYRNGEPGIVFSPAPGRHLVWYQRRPILLYRARQEQSTGGNGYTTQAPRETITIVTPGRSAARIRALLTQAYEELERNDVGKVAVYVNATGGTWRHVADIEPRPLDSVILPPGVAENVESDLKAFFDAKEWYRDLGIPWRRGYLLHGPPGAGKSSLVAALAGALQFNVYTINLAGYGMSDTTLVQLLLDMPPRSAVLFEDVDALLNERKVEASEESSVTFAGLLNALDGVASRPGLVTFMTTNHPDRLDPALVRPGRVDRKVAFTYATATQAEALFLRFFGDVSRDLAGEFGVRVAARRTMAMAEVQQLLLEHRAAPHDALAAIPEPTLAVA